MNQKHAIRAAVKLFDACQNMRLKPQSIISDILQDSIGRLLSVISTYNAAIDKGWNSNSAADNVTTQRYCVRQALNTVENCINENSAQRTSLKPDLQSIYSDIIHLEDEFEAVTVDLQRSIISVETESIAFEGIDLGRFEIQVNLGSMDYYVKALDPNPSSRDYIHPHINSGTLCEGNGSAAISSAMKTGRLLDLFTILRSILETYNPDSPYQAIEQWDGGSTCSGCGCSVDEEESSSCESCGDINCADCIVFCSGCESHRCLCCFTVKCEYCESPLCSEFCGRSCSECGNVYCRECADDKFTVTVCAVCSEKLSETVDV